MRREALREALVATYVCGKRKRSSPSGSGPASLQKIPTVEGLDTALAHAITTLSEHSVGAAYARLPGIVSGLGPWFYAKFLYFAGKTVPSATGPRPLVLDRFWSGVCGPWLRGRLEDRPSSGNEFHVHLGHVVQEVSVVELLAQLGVRDDIQEDRVDADVDNLAGRQPQPLAPVVHRGQQVGIALAQDPGGHDGS